MSCTASTGGGVLPVLNDSRQTSLRVAISAVDGLGNRVYEGFWSFEVVEVGTRFTLRIAVEQW